MRVRALPHRAHDGGAATLGAPTRREMDHKPDGDEIGARIERVKEKLDDDQPVSRSLIFERQVRKNDI